jgi:hypothetical protein
MGPVFIELKPLLLGRGLLNNNRYVTVNPLAPAAIIPAFGNIERGCFTTKLAAILAPAAKTPALPS